MPLSDSPIQMPARKFSADQKGHRSNNQAIEQFGNVASYSFVPIGAFLPFAGITNPPGYLKCDGAAVSRTVYAALFSVIGTQYGVGDGSTTFNVPTYAQCVQVMTGGHNHGGVTTGAGTTAAVAIPSFGMFIIRTGAT